MSARYTDYDSHNTSGRGERPRQDGSEYMRRENSRPYPERVRSENFEGRAAKGNEARRSAAGEYDGERYRRDDYDSRYARGYSSGVQDERFGRPSPYRQNGPQARTTQQSEGGAPRRPGQYPRSGYGEYGSAPQSRPARQNGSGAYRGNDRTSVSTDGYGGSRRPAQDVRGREGGAPRRPGQGSYARNYSGYPQKSVSMSQIITAILCVALLITVCLAVTSRIQSNEQRPVISQNVDASGEPSTQATVLSDRTEEPSIQPASETPRPTDEVSPVGTGRSVTIRAIGDVIISDEMLDTALVDKNAKTYDFSPLFSMAGEVMSNADWSIINIEATLREGKYGYSGYPQFSTPPSILQALKNVGIDMLTMCNNHALDGYFDGLKISLDLVEEAGLEHVGAYRTQEEHDTPEIYELGGIQVGMLNYTQALNSMDKVSDEAATVYGLRIMKGADYAGDIAKLRAAGAEAVVVFMHWGEEYERYPEDDTQAIAKKLIAAGADIVVGGHPHVVQPAEYVTATDANGNSRTGLVLYSMGNFISNHRNEKKAHTDNGVILEFTLAENDAGEVEVVDPCVIPVYVWQTGIEGNYDYRVLPSGQYLDNPPSGMSATEYERMKESWNQTVELMNGVIPVIAG